MKPDRRRLVGPDEFLASRLKARKIDRLARGAFSLLTIAAVLCNLIAIITMDRSWSFVGATASGLLVVLGVVLYRQRFG